MTRSQHPTGMDFDHFTYANGNVDIYCRAGSNWVLWALVRDSVVVPRGGKGLFAARPFAEGQCVGRYVGRVLGRPSDPAVQRASQTVHGDAIVTIQGFDVDGRRPVQSNEEQLRLCGRVIFKQPNWSWPGVYAHIANDAWGTGREYNAMVTQGGYMYAKRRIPSYDFARPHSQNGASEILWPYGPGYWEETARLGTSALPYMVND